MTVGHETPISAVESLHLGRPFWLPPFGRGNGLEALYWACLADLPEDLVETALEALRHEDIAGWASPVHPVGEARYGKGTAGKPYRLWVATLRYERAEDIMLQVLNDGR